jgi:hypothetical protein
VRLRQLADAGLLVRNKLVRAGARRYYKMPDPWAVYRILTGKPNWLLNRMARYFLWFPNQSLAKVTN